MFGFFHRFCVSAEFYAVWRFFVGERGNPQTDGLSYHNAMEGEGEALLVYLFALIRRATRNSSSIARGARFFAFTKQTNKEDQKNIRWGDDFSPTLWWKPFSINLIWFIYVFLVRSRSSFWVKWKRIAHTWTELSSPSSRSTSSYGSLCNAEVRFLRLETSRFQPKLEWTVFRALKQ